MATENTVKKPMKRKKRNAFVRYFIPFGLKQVCDIVLLLAAITVIVGLCVYENATTVVLIVGLALFILGSLLAVYRSCRVLFSKINKRSPEYKSATVNTIIMSVIAVIAIIGIFCCQ